MSYHLKSKPPRGRYLHTVITFSLFFLLVLCAIIFPNLTRSVSYTISRPLWLIRDGAVNIFVGTKNFFSFKSTLVSTNKSLEEEITSLTLKQADYNVLVKENQDLKNLNTETIGTSRITARVLSKPPSSPYDTFVIDVGSGEGVALGNKVYLSNNIVIGIVTSVTPHTSLVELFSTGSRKQEATVSRTGASFEITGKGGANFQLEVPKDTDILWGDVFLYPTRSASVLGSVYYIDTNSQSSFKTVYVRIPGNVFSTQWLFVER